LRGTKNGGTVSDIVDVRTLEFEAGKKHIVVFTLNYNSLGPVGVKSVSDRILEHVWPPINDFLNDDRIGACVVLPDYVSLELKKVDPE